MKHVYNLGMPYMGSKRKLSKELIDFMLKENPNAKYFYDVFGGGGAMSFEALQRPQIKEVFYNEFNTGVVELLKDMRDNGITDKYFQWIDRDTFNENKTKDTFLGGLCKVIWSFGNNQDGYLFGKEIECDKKLLHLMVVNKCKKSLNTFNKKYKLDLKMNDGLFDENMTQRRFRMTHNIKNTIRDEFLQDGIIKNAIIMTLLEQLARLEHLERLTKLQQLQQLQISNLSYEQVDINTHTSETIIYLDPPYEDTAKYAKGICHKEFYKWVDVLTENGYKVYISSYKSHLPCVLEIKHTCSLSATSTNEVIEKLFTNKSTPYIEIIKEAVQGSLF